MSTPGQDGKVTEEQQRQQAKSLLRTKIRSEREPMAAAKRARVSARICALLKGQAVWQAAQTVLFYAPLPDEPDTWPLVSDAFADNKVVAVPRYNPDENSYVACQLHDPDTDLAPGRFGIREPKATCPLIALNRLDLVLVPGLGFDLAGHRLGRGKGYYDRLLPVVRGTKCGVAFDAQVGIEIPVEPHDVRLDYIVTPTRWLAVASQSEF